ncbi:unnamed protein product [Chrysoparadoxa australica]
MLTIPAQPIGGNSRLGFASMPLRSAAEEFEVTWSQLESSLLPILQDIGSGFPNDKWMSLYSGVYTLCTKPSDPQHSRLYAKVKEMLEHYVEGVLRGLQTFDEATAHGSTDLLVRYRDAFENYSTGMKYGAELFAYLDRHWIKTNHCETGSSPKDGVYFVYEMALVVWKDRVFESLKVRLRSNVIRVINNARTQDLDNLNDDGVVKSLLQTYEQLGFEKRDRSQLFKEELEDYLAEDTRTYFGMRGQDLLQRMPVAEYLKEVAKYLQLEEARCGCFLGDYSVRRILVSTQKSLIAAHAGRLVEEAGAMLVAQPEQREDLRRLYTLIGYLDDVDSTAVVGGGGSGNASMLALEEVVQAHIRQDGLSVVKDLQARGGMDVSDEDNSSSKKEIGSDDVVHAMLQVYEHYKASEGLVKESFKDSPGFQTVLNEACKAFVNAVPRAPEWLARYAHCLLDKGFKESKLSEESRRDALDRVGFLFAYIADKDIFHKYYAKLLSKRIIQLTSVSDDAEERMLANMRKISGFEYTSKLQRMFVDKALSRDLHTGYVDWQERRARQRHSALLASGDVSGCFNFTDDEEHASRMLEEMNVSGHGGEVNSPPLSPMYFSPKGLSPRMNILPSFAWGKTMLKHLKRRHPHPQMGGRVHAPRTDGASASSNKRVVEEKVITEEEAYAFLAARESHQLFLMVPSFEAFTFVLTAGCWPLQSVSSEFKPPQPIKEYVDSFLEFYSEAHSGRRLEWLYHLGHGEMVTHCFDKRYQVYSSTFQMGILHQFNNCESLTVSEISTCISISESEIVRHLFPLIKAGLLVVNVIGTSKPAPQSCDDLAGTDAVSINFGFVSKRTRIKINIVDHSRQPAKEEQAVAEVITDRKVSVQAAICRVMKARKEATHRELCREVCKHVEHLFTPDTPSIKKAIEDLIGKDYLERVPDKEAYKYVS